MEDGECYDMEQNTKDTEVKLHFWHFFYLALVAESGKGEVVCVCV